MIPYLFDSTVEYVSALASELEMLHIQLGSKFQMQSASKRYTPALAAPWNPGTCNAKSKRWMRRCVRRKDCSSKKKRLQNRTSAIPAFCWRVTLILYVLQEWHAAAAVRYLRDKMHRKEDEVGLTCQVEACFLEASIDELCAVYAPHHVKDVAAFEAAKAWIQ